MPYPRLESRRANFSGPLSSAFSIVATIDATHDANPNHAIPSRHKRIGRVDRKNTRKHQTCNHSPNPSMRTLIQRQGPGSVLRLILPAGSVGALCVLLSTEPRQCHSDRRQALRRNHEERSQKSVVFVTPTGVRGLQRVRVARSLLNRTALTAARTFGVCTHCRDHTEA